jgi:SpoVK/Ycf46/Vps4 family AAA+-type ATPase
LFAALHCPASFPFFDFIEGGGDLTVSLSRPNALDSTLRRPCRFDREAPITVPDHSFTPLLNASIQLLFRPNALDPALRRPGRFDREVAVTVPTTAERLAILRLHSRSLPLADDVILEEVASSCNGYTGADLAALSREAAMLAMAQESRGEGVVLGEFRRGGCGSGEVERGSAVGSPEELRSVDEFRDVSRSFAGVGGSADGSAGKSGNAEVSGSGELEQQADGEGLVRNDDSGSARDSSGARDNAVNLDKSRHGANGMGGPARELETRPRGVCMADWRAAMLRVGPSVVRGSTAEVPPVTWDDIGGLQDVKVSLMMSYCYHNVEPDMERFVQ